MVCTVVLQVNFQHKLVEVCGDKREAVFELLTEEGSGQTITVPVSTHTLTHSLPLFLSLTHTHTHTHTSAL